MFHRHGGDAMTGLRDFHTSVFDFATKVMTAVECQRGNSERSSHVTATIAIDGNGDSRDITIAFTPALSPDNQGRCCRVIWGSKDASIESKDVEAYGVVRSRAGP